MSEERGIGQGAADCRNDLYEAAARRFEALFDGIPIACFTFDRSGAIFEWNMASEALWERTSDEAFQAQIGPTLHRLADDTMLESAVERVFEGEKVVGLEWKAEFDAGRFKWVLANAFPVRSPDGRITGGVMACMDVTTQKLLQEQVESQLLEISQARILLEFQRDQLAEANSKLEDLATKDGLTELRNHRAFQEFFEQQFQIAKRSKDPLSLLFLDVDKFKNLNDTYGHPAGDDVLRGIARVLEEMARRSDFVARYGGEEFAVVLPHTDVQGAMDAGERFRAAIETESFRVGTVTASFGAATMNPQDASHHDLITRADMALYGSKRAGRNCVTHWNGLSKVAA